MIAQVTTLMIGFSVFSAIMLLVVYLFILRHLHQGPVAILSCVALLGALSTLCNHCLESSTAVRQCVRSLRDAVLQVADDLATILEQSTGSEETEGVVPWTFLSILRVLSTHQHKQARLTNKQAQTILQSGLFRQWMLLWQRQESRQIPRAVRKTSRVRPHTAKNQAFGIRFARGQVYQLRATLGKKLLDIDQTNR